MQTQHQRGTPFVDPDEPGPDQLVPAEVEGAAAEGLEGRVDRPAGAPQILALQIEVPVVGELDMQLARRVRHDPGPQDVVVTLDQRQCLLQMRRVDGPLEVVGGAQVECRGAGIQRVVHPQVVLRGAERHPAGRVARRYDGGYLAGPARLQEAAQQTDPLFPAQCDEPVGHGGGCRDRDGARNGGGAHHRFSFSSANRCSPASTSSRPMPKSMKQATSSTPSSARSASILAQWPGEPSRLPQLR